MKRSFDINLFHVVPDENHLKENQTRLIWPAAAVIILGILWTGSYVWLHNKEAMQIATIAALRPERASADNNEEERIGQLEHKLAVQMEAIKTIEDANVKFSKLLGEIEADISANIHLNQITAENDSIICQGTASDFVVLGRFMIDLSKSAGLRTPVCRSAEKMDGGVKFQLLIEIPHSEGNQR